MMHHQQKELNVITAFIEEIGIDIIYTALNEPCFLPGLKLYRGRILVDKSKLQYPGDLLHEAGHIAVTLEAQRPLIGTPEMPEDWPSAGDEIVTILWSYAALQKLNLAPEVVFHENGYKNQSKWLIEQFESKNYIGLPLLTWMGLCHESNNEDSSVPAFPKMIKWLR
ncbi:hypothetical protein P8625_02265 [Tenacibaculum tangerinum]|uniref:IrrE N-terminal-like domain-containing protein n=1 Tax=Tenacibaculum tangerinum TaxID=3038772 RepID=A0ABY8L3K4_9FLAO|nr:hypothetical protein [Tenacibaculum tangerinum]WGH76014.1 hypothetical protein P8625_02265 [Tenacibaculum tangerinum]